MREVLLFVCFQMPDDTNPSSKLSVADGTREIWGRKLCWWFRSTGFPLNTFLLGFADFNCFLFTCTPSYDVSSLCLILCDLFPGLSLYVEVLKGGLFLSLYRFFCLTWEHSHTCSSPYIFLRHESRNKGMKHSWKHFPRLTWESNPVLPVKIQCSNHWAKESTPWRSCQRLYIYLQAMRNLQRQIIEGRSARP